MLSVAASEDAFPPTMQILHETSAYTIGVERGRALIRITLRGFWDEEIFRRFKRDARDAALSLGEIAGEHSVIADASAAAIQSREVATLLTSYMAGKRFRFAFVTGKAGIKLQARRIFGQAGAMVVDTIEDAESALFGAP